MAFASHLPTHPRLGAYLRLTLFALLGAALPGLAQAQATPPRVKAEIGALMSRLEASGCQFYRNGTWYPGAEAKTHLNRKFVYFDARGGASSAEQFIDQAATRSSMSGQAYLVQCGAAAPVESNAWLKAQLAILRKAQADAGR
jgi:Family of unknown function (DUF5329)